MTTAQRTPDDSRDTRHPLSPTRATARLMVSVALGLAAAAWLSPAHAPWWLRVLGGWDVASFTLSALAWNIIARSGAPQTQRRATVDDPGHRMIFVIVIGSSLVGLFAAAVVLRWIKAMHSRPTGLDDGGARRDRALLDPHPHLLHASIRQAVLRRPAPDKGQRLPDLSGKSNRPRTSTSRTLRSPLACASRPRTSRWTRGRRGGKCSRMRCCVCAQDDDRGTRTESRDQPAVVAAERRHGRCGVPGGGLRYHHRMLNYIWFGLMAIALVVAAFNGTVDGVTGARWNRRRPPCRSPSASSAS